MKKNKLALFSAPYVLWMAVFVVIPILMIVVYAFSSAGGGFTLENFARIGDYMVVFTRSFKLAFIATAICLLLAAGQRGDRPLLKALQVDHLQHLQHPLLDLRLRKLDLPAALWVGLWDPKAKGDVFKYIQVGEKGVPLEHGVDGPLMGRNIIDPHAVKKNVPLCGRLKTANDTKCGGFAAPTGTQQREEFLIVDV